MEGLTSDELDQFLSEIELEVDTILDHALSGPTITATTATPPASHRFAFSSDEGMETVRQNSVPKNTARNTN